LRVVLALALLLTACPNGPSLPEETDTCTGEAPPADGKPTVVLGRQVDGPFQALAEGDSLQIVHGPQGGQHVYVVVRLYAKATGIWFHTFRFFDAGGATLGEATTPVSACGPGWTTSDHTRVFLHAANPADGTLEIVSHLKDAPDGSPEGTLSQRVSVSVR
jgi:hypothetical protein